MLEETLRPVPSTTLSDFAIWKVNDSDEVKNESEFQPALYPSAATAMGSPVSVNRSKWYLLVLCLMFALVALPFFASPRMHIVEAPKPWTNARSYTYHSLPNGSEVQKIEVSQSISQKTGSLAVTFNYTAKYGLAYVLLPVKLMSKVKRTFSHWIGWLREAFDESAYVDLE